MDADLLPRRAGLTPEKITREHQQRLAIIYIRQSTPQQVERNQESTKLQYALVDRAFHFGWARETIVTIDDDLGRSGSTVEGRLGFQRLVAEVGLGHVGLVLGIEMSRLARSCRDWHQLLEICALFDTLIADVDGVYDPANYNDRLLLGLKGTMSEAELHILQARMLAGRNAKARRGDLGKPLPMGYLRRPSGEVALDPDEQAQSVIRLVFDLFDRLRTVSGVLRYLVQNDIKMPVRLTGGPGKGELEWRRPSRPSLGDLFSNPIYAGVYVYGVRPIDRRRHKPGRPEQRATTAAPGECRGVPARSSAGLHHLGAVPAQSGANPRQSNERTGSHTRRRRIALRADRVRPVRLAHDGHVQQRRPCGALPMHRRAHVLGRAVLPSAEGRAGGC